MVKFNATFCQDEKKIDVLFHDSFSFPVNFGLISEVEKEIDIYDGPLDIEPSNIAQVLETSEKKITDNIIIEPIPSNYGRIIWNGATMTIV